MSRKIKTSGNECYAWKPPRLNRVCRTAVFQHCTAENAMYIKPPIA